MNRRMLTARDVGEQLGVSAEAVLRWIRRGELPAFRLPGGAIRIREAELEAWLASRATRADTRQTSAPAPLTRSGA